MVGGSAIALVLVIAAVAFAAAGGGRGGAPADDSVDVGFLHDMIDHHEQAVRMSLLVIGADGVAPAVRDAAVGVIASQRHDLGRMEAWLVDWGIPARGAPAREAMTWMDHHPVAPEAMPGMATPAELAALGSSTGAAAERQFLDLMLEHHRSGVTMAEHAAAHAGEEKVVRLAELIVAGQQEEILELESLRRQLTAEGSLEVPAS